MRPVRSGSGAVNCCLSVRRPSLCKVHFTDGTYLLTDYCMLVNGEPSLRNEASEVRQLRGELLAMRDKVERLINRLELAAFTAATTATVATDNNDALPSDGLYLLKYFLQTETNKLE